MCMKKLSYDLWLTDDLLYLYWNISQDRTFDKFILFAVNVLSTHFSTCTI